MTKLKYTLAMLSLATLYLLTPQQAQAATLYTASSSSSTASTTYQLAFDYDIASQLASPAPAPAPAPAPKKHTRKRKQTASKNSKSKHQRNRSTRPRRTSGGSGFSYERMEVAASTPTQIKTILDHGQELLGLRYRTSGIAKWPLDCSGFVSYICSLEGIKTPRSSGALSVYTDRITDPKPGDLLFFKGRNRGASRVGHVAMVISNEGGDIKMMHSSNSRGIVIESLNNSAYFSSRYLGAGRLPEVKEYWKEATPGAPSSLD